jgi:hypothetical protein
MRKWLLQYHQPQKPFLFQGSATGGSPKQTKGEFNFGIKSIIHFWYPPSSTVATMSLFFLLVRKGFLEKAMAKVSASIEAEAAALAGCKIEIMDIGGVLKIASIQHPITRTVFYWLGAVNKWRYITAKDFRAEHSKTE